MDYDTYLNIYLNLNQPILKQLKQLGIYGITINLETLNSLGRLVHLEIVKCEIEELHNNVLSLSLLEILKLDTLKYIGFKNLLVASTKLQRLKLKGSYVQLAEAKRITYLDVDSYSVCQNFLPSCINLQYFYCNNLNSVDLQRFKLVKNLSKLKSIHFDANKVLVSLVVEKQYFNKDLKFYFRNLELSDDMLAKSDRQLVGKSMAKLYAQYYSRLADHFPSVRHADYNDLERCFNQIPDKFMLRFVNCNRLIINEKVNDLDQLIRVLGECKTIRDLKLHSSLGQHFFDFHLYELCPNIDKLTILGDQVLDCEFILKFKYIRELIVHQILPVELLKQLAKILKGAHTEIIFYHREFQISIKKYVVKRRTQEPRYYLSGRNISGWKWFSIKSFNDLYKLSSSVSKDNCFFSDLI